MSVKANPVMAAAARTKRDGGASARGIGEAVRVAATVPVSSWRLPFFFRLLFVLSVDKGFGAGTGAVRSTSDESAAIGVVCVCRDQPSASSRRKVERRVPATAPSVLDP